LQNGPVSNNKGDEDTIVTSIDIEDNREASTMDSGGENGEESGDESGDERGDENGDENGSESGEANGDESDSQDGNWEPPKRRISQTEIPKDAHTVSIRHSTSNSRKLRSLPIHQKNNCRQQNLGSRHGKLVLLSTGIVIDTRYSHEYRRGTYHCPANADMH